MSPELRLSQGWMNNPFVVQHVAGLPAAAQATAIASFAAAAATVESRASSEGGKALGAERSSDRLGVDDKEAVTEEGMEGDLPRHMQGRAPDFKAEGGGDGNGLKFASDRETDARRLAQRQRQIDFGKNTTGYDRYLQAVPIHKRTKYDPETPDVGEKQSKKKFDWKVRTWRRRLHRWDDKPSPTTTTTATPAAEERELKPTSSEDKGGIKNTPPQDHDQNPGMGKEMSPPSSPRRAWNSPTAAAIAAAGGSGQDVGMTETRLSTRTSTQ